MFKRVQKTQKYITLLKMHNVQSSLTGSNHSLCHISHDFCHILKCSQPCSAVSLLTNWAIAWQSYKLSKIVCLFQRIQNALFIIVAPAIHSDLGPDPDLHQSPRLVDWQPAAHHLSHWPLQASQQLNSGKDLAFAKIFCRHSTVIITVCGGALQQWGKMS